MLDPKAEASRYETARLELLPMRDELHIAWHDLIPRAVYSPSTAGDACTRVQARLEALELALRVLEERRDALLKGPDAADERARLEKLDARHEEGC